jgi:FkbM family methyltransferase
MKKPMLTNVNIIRAITKIYPFQGLRLANWAFGKTPSVMGSVFGFDMEIQTSRSTTHRLLAAMGNRFVPETNFLDAMIETGDRVLDVGANIGYFTAYFASKVGPSGKVFAIEPEPTNFSELSRFVQRNPRLESVVQLYNLAAGETDGVLEFSEGINGRVANQGNSISVSCRPIDSLNLDPIDLVKIDVEGFEGQVLNGMNKLINGQRPKLFIELHPWMLTYGESVESIITSLRRSYASLKIFRSDRDEATHRKIARRLGAISTLVSIEIDDYIRENEVQANQSPSWLVCHN